jgi:hypothetical protein
MPAPLIASYANGHSEAKGTVDARDTECLLGRLQKFGEFESGQSKSCLLRLTFLRQLLE